MRRSSVPSVPLSLPDWAANVIRSVGEAACRLQQPVEGTAFPETVEAAQRCDDALADLFALAAVFDDLEVGVRSADFCTTEHGASL